MKISTTQITQVPLTMKLSTKPTHQVPTTIVSAILDMFPHEREHCGVRYKHNDNVCLVFIDDLDDGKYNEATDSKALRSLINKSFPDVEVFCCAYVVLEDNLNYIVISLASI